MKEKNAIIVSALMGTVNLYLKEILPEVKERPKLQLNSAIKAVTHFLSECKNNNLNTTEVSEKLKLIIDETFKDK